MELRVAGKWRVGRRLGSGSFGDVYIGTNLQTFETVAIKMENINIWDPRLVHEAKIYKTLAGGVGVPHVHWYGAEGDYNIMVCDLLGPSVEDLFQNCNCSFYLKTVLMLADQMVSRLEYVHAKNYIHRDIKPDNFAIGVEKKANRVHIIDFGLAKEYRDPLSREHIQYKEGKYPCGTVHFSSVNTLRGIQQSRRDDLEALGYMLIYLNRGKLPWQGLSIKDKSKKKKMIVHYKANTPIEQMCRKCPPEFVTYLKYCRSLGFEDRPDYAYLREQLKGAFLREGYKDDFVFDWGFLKSDEDVNRAILQSDWVHGPAFLKNRGSSLGDQCVAMGNDPWSSVDDDDLDEDDEEEGVVFT